MAETVPATTGSPTEPEPCRRAPRVVVVDDDHEVLRVLGQFFRREGWETRTFDGAPAALQSLVECPTDIVVSDLTMPGLSGLEFLAALRRQGVLAPFLLLTAHGTIASAVQALKEGAFDYLTKPFDFQDVRTAARQAYLEAQLQRETAGQQPDGEGTGECGRLIGRSAAMQPVYHLIRLAARTQATVLILGESGTGKELVARSLHDLSTRAKAKFVGVSCAALPSELLESELFGHEKGSFTGANNQRIGRFELADRGTLFLDEIGDISGNVQAKLLRVLQEREIDRVGGSRPIKVDVRLLSATNRDLPAAVARGDFREDLYYRLRVVEIELPPLRERKEDIPLLCSHFFTLLNRRDHRQLEELSPSAQDMLDAHSWPGNVRELENAIEHAVVLAPEAARRLEPEFLPENIRSAASAATAAAPTGLLAELEATEQRLIRQALDRNNWDLRGAAADLGLPLSSLHYRIRKYRFAGRPPRT